MTTSPGFVARTGLSASFFFRLNLPPGSAATEAEPSTAASCDSGGCAGSRERVSAAVSLKPRVSLFSPIEGSESAAVSDAALSITKWAASANSGPSMVMVTSASPRGGRLVVPLKMQSAMRSARSDLWLCSPRTQEMASTTLDLPQPLGPTMHVVPDPLNVTTVRSQNDLKPTISTFRSFSKISPLVVNYSTAASTKLENKSITAKASHPQRLGLERAKRDDVSFLEGRVFGSIGRPYTGRLSKRLAGSQSEAQPPGARMAVRKKTVTRCVLRVKPYAASCGYVAGATRIALNPQSLASRLLGGWRHVFQVLVVPGEDAVQTVQQMFFFVEAVRLARVDDQFRFDAVAFEAAVEFLALARRVDRVGVALKDQGGRFHILQMHEGRTVQEAGDLLRFVGEAVEPLVVGRTLLGAVFGDEIGQSRTGDCCLEHIGLRDRPLGHISTVRPSTDAEPLGIGNTTFDQVVDPGHHVSVIAAAPIAAIHLDEFLSVTARAANVGIEDGVAVSRKELPPGFDRVLPGTRGAAMDQGDERQLRLAIVPERLQKSCFDFQAVEGLVSVEFRGAE